MMLTRKGQKKNVQNLEDVVERMNELDSAVDVKPVMCPNKVTVALPLVEPAVTRNVDSEVDPGPVETDSETDS